MLLVLFLAVIVGIVVVASDSFRLVILRRVRFDSSCVRILCGAEETFVRKPFVAVKLYLLSFVLIPL